MPLLILLIAIFALASTSRSSAQATSGSITGFVTGDPGGALPHVEVNVKGENNGVVTSCATDDAGFFNTTHIIAGNYSATVEANGFKKFVKQHIVFGVDFDGP